MSQFIYPKVDKNLETTEGETGSRSRLRCSTKYPFYYKQTNKWCLNGDRIRLRLYQKKDVLKNFKIGDGRNNRKP